MQPRHRFSNTRVATVASRTKGKTMCDEANYRDKADAAQVNAGQAVGSLKASTEAREPTISRLHRRAQQSAAETENSVRALQILKRHPEFEDLIWLIRSGLVALLMVVMVCTPMRAQQPPQQTPAQVEIQKEATSLQDHIQLLYEKLHGLQEFTDYLTAVNKMQQLQQQYQAAAAKPEPAKPAAPANTQPAAQPPTK
jgi:hypothetical protein